MSARRLLSGLILTLALLLCGLGCWRWWPRVVDDAYITFHYAQNLVDGLGPVYNVGERVEGYSSPSWLVLSAAAIAVGIDPVACAKWVGLLATLSLLALTFFAARERASATWGAALVALLLGSSMVLQIWSVSGLETNLYALFFLAGLLSLASQPATRRSLLLASTLLVAAALTRPEGLLFWGCGLLVAVLAGNRDVRAVERIRRLMVYLLPASALLLHFVWRLDYYGAILPNTYYAKTGGGLRMWRQGLHGLSIFLSNPAHWIWIAAAAAGAVLGLTRADRRLRVGLLTGAVLIHVAYIVSVGDDGLRVHRFYVAILAPLALLVGELFAFADSGRPRTPRFAALGVLAVLATTTASVHSLHFDLLPRTLPGLLIYQQGNTKLGRHLRSTLPPDTLIAVAAAGAIPFYSRLPSIDMFGLNDARIARSPFPRGVRGRILKWDNEYVLSRKPRMIVVNRGYVASGDSRATELLRNPAALAVSPMDRDLFQRLVHDRSYFLRPLRLDDGSLFFVFERSESRSSAGSQY